VALLTFLIHGLFDMFLEYSATYLLLWALIGALGSLTNFRGAEDKQLTTQNGERYAADRL
jgi:hypothetical protein